MPNSLNKNLSFHLPKSLKSNTKMLLWLALGVLLVMEGFVLKNSISIVLSVQQDAPIPPSGQGVRINFAAYKSDVQRIQNAGSFVPASEAEADPFIGTGKGVQVTPSAATGTSATATSTGLTTSSTSGN